MRAGFALLSFFLLSDAFCQKHDYNWVFSTSYRDTTNVLLFNPSSDYLDHPFNPDDVIYGVTNSSMSDDKGDLIYTSNGCVITESDFTIMANGENINPGEPHRINCGRGYIAGHQSALSLPLPGNDSLYYLIHQSQIYIQDTKRIILRDALRYSLIDISANYGNGRVLKKNVVLSGDTSIYGASITAVKHTDNKSWWLINPVHKDSSYYTWLITTDTIKGPYEQHIGRLAIPTQQAGGGAQFTPDGNKYIRWNPKDGIFIMDFDRTSGLLSNFKWVDHRIDTVIFGGMAISPNSRFLYTTTLLDLYQYDLWADDILASRVHIDTYDGHLSPFVCNLWAGQLGPDCKIYFNSTSSCSKLHVIHRPDLKGRACDFRQHDLDIKYSHRASLPHFPNYRLGTGPVCDSTLSVQVINVPIKAKPKVTIRPNPNQGLFSIDTDLTYDKIEIYDLNGRLIITSTDAEIDISSGPDGMYLLLFRKKGEVLYSESVVKNSH